MLRFIVLFVAALALTACGAGFNPGCKGKENTTAWCKFQAP